MKRLALVLAGPVVFLGLLEGFLFLTGGFEPVRVLKAVTHEGRAYWATNPDYGPFALSRPDAPMPHHIWLRQEKNPERLRVVMLGESAVAGFPSEEYSLGRMTRVLWNDRFPERPMEIATLAMVGSGSHILRKFAAEAMQMKPDVLVIYAGHNEVIGPYGPVSQFTRGLSTGWLARLSLSVRNTRTGRAMESAFDAASRAMSGSEEKSWKGLDEHRDAQIAADEPALDTMLGQTRENFRAIIDLATRNDCKVLVCVPAVNLNDWPPMASAKEEGKSAAQEYALGRKLEAEGRMSEAWPHYRRACDLDLLRFRADSRVRQAQRDIVGQIASPEVILVDADRWLHEWNPAFKNDRAYFLEHVHLNFEGRVAVAALIADGIAELTGEVPPSGVGREAYPGVAQWWEEFPSRVQTAKDRVLFTEFDDAYLWDATQRLLAMKVFSGMEDIDARRRHASAQAEVLRAQGFARWPAAVVEQAREKAAALEPEDGWVDLKAAEILANLGDFRKARGHIDTAGEKFPRLAQVHMARAQEALRDGEAKLALRHLDDLGELLPSGAKPAAIYADAYLAAGDPVGAIPYLRKMTRIHAAKADSWSRLAGAQASAGRTEDAIATCRTALEKTGQSAILAARLARLLAEKENATTDEKNEALVLARAAAQTEPDNPAHGETLALALMVNGYESEAKAEAGRIVAQAYAAGKYDIVTSVNQTLNRAKKKQNR